MTLSKRKIPRVPFSAAKLADLVKASQDDADRQLDVVINAASEEAANRRPAKTEWNTKEVIAHLVHYERFLSNWINQLVFSQESFSDGFSDNLLPRVQATANVYGTLKDVYAEFKKNQAELVNLAKNLPKEFTTRKSSWWRMGYTLLTYNDHTIGHIPQIRAALKS